MNRIQELSRKITRGELVVPLDPPLPRWPRSQRRPGHTTHAGGAARASAKPSRNPAT